MILLDIRVDAVRKASANGKLILKKTHPLYPPAKARKQSLRCARGGLTRLNH